MRNPHLKYFTNAMRERFSDDSSAMTNSEWLFRNTTLRNKPFKSRHYQQAILDDNSQDLSIIKCSQIGLTEIEVRKMLTYCVRIVGFRGIFALPIEDMRKRIYNGRVKPIVDLDKVFTSPTDIRIGSVRSSGTLQFKQSFLYLTSCTEGAATSIDADAVFLDELDLSDQKMAALFQSRTQGSDNPMHHRFSTPTFHGYGIDALYQISDKHQYLAKCTKCNSWNNPEFNSDFVHLEGFKGDMEFTLIPENLKYDLDFTRSYVKCQKCSARLDLDNPKLRAWVAEDLHPNVPRGYKITPFCDGRLDPKYILTKKWTYDRTNAVRQWYNTVLGLPYTDESIQVSKQAIDYCFTTQAGIPDTGGERVGVEVGIDIGRVCHIVIAIPDRSPAGGHEIISMYTCRNINLLTEIERIKERYYILSGCIDLDPEPTLSYNVHTATQGKIIPVRYSRAPTSPHITLKYDEMNQIDHASVNRTTFLDLVQTVIYSQKIRISGYAGQRELIVKHFRAMVRDDTEKMAKWVKLNSEDHYFHATGYMLNSSRVIELAEGFSRDPRKTTGLLGLGSFGGRPKDQKPTGVEKISGTILDRRN